MAYSVGNMKYYDPSFYGLRATDNYNFLIAELDVVMDCDIEVIYGLCSEVSYLPDQCTLVYQRNEHSFLRGLHIPQRHNEEVVDIIKKAAKSDTNATLLKRENGSVVFNNGGISGNLKQFYDALDRLQG